MPGTLKPYRQRQNELTYPTETFVKRSETRNFQPNEAGDVTQVTRRPPERG